MSTTSDSSRGPGSSAQAKFAAADIDVKTLTHEEGQRLRRKIDWHLMPLMCSKMTFADKTTLGQSAVLGIIPSNKLSQNQFNWLGTIFSLSFLFFEYPQNLALQRFPVGKWMSLNIFVWAVALLCHAACKSFGALFTVRFILGACEGAITPGFMIVTSMFYTREEQTRRVGYWFLMNGFAIIFLGFTSFGTPNFKPWQWLMIITGLITLIVSLLFWLFFPDSPTNAWFLTPEERVQAIERIKVNQSGVENKRWKKDQFLETLKDPKVWIMALFAAVVNVPNSLINQRQIIVNQFGFAPIHTTLIGCVDGVVEILTIWLGVSLTRIPALGRGYTSILMFVPALLGSLLVNTLRDSNRVGLLFSYWVSVFFIVPFPIFLGWAGSIVSGHTKRTTTNAIILIAYALGNAAGPFMWKKEYQPRNHIPWVVISSCIFSGAVLIFILRTLLARENARRDAETRDETYDDVYVLTEKPDGTKVETRVDKTFLDLTDLQNRDFRYIL
ncbi:major facilitator superfamily domain-containing protein [Ephemerocybe angulata]|uniref:Major facilitator superfamily domain-containing protein n=1 Tax=Ephemerocybe angulata TaxID=980116 RepID=A0A8H6IE20_9AGAR|nr:major facilitator superfamily domain-containing protein [Tulosesus angulatus]